MTGPTEPAYRFLTATEEKPVTQSWSEHVRDVTGDYPQAVPGQIVDLTNGEPVVADLRDPNDPFGPGDSLDISIPPHLLKGGARNDRYFEWR